MSPDEQEALSHTYSHGVWLVPLESGNFAVFSRIGSDLIEIVPGDETLAFHLWRLSQAAYAEHLEVDKRQRAKAVSNPRNIKLPSFEELGL